MIRLKKSHKSQMELFKQHDEHREKEHWFSSIIESSDDLICMVDSKTRYLFANRRHLAWLGQDEEAVLGKPFCRFNPDCESNEFTAKIQRVLETGEPVRYEHRRDGSCFLSTFSPVVDPDDGVVAVSVISKDISELKHLEDELRTMTIVDDLTGLYNRRGFSTLTDQQLSAARRKKKPVYMLYADLDNLKTINDTLGHNKGDRALVSFASILKETYRECDIVARIGGDEFAVFPLTADEGSVRRIVERLTSRIQDYNRETTEGFTISASIGITRCRPDCPKSVDELLDEADRSMYEQKRNNRRGRSDLRLN